MATAKFNKVRLLIILFIALLCVYTSQVLIIFYGINRQTVAGEILFFIVGSTTHLFFDFLLPGNENRNNIVNSKNIIGLGLFLILVDWYLNIFYDIHLVLWLIMAIYTVYFIHFSVRIGRIKPVIEDN